MEQPKIRDLIDMWEENLVSQRKQLIYQLIENQLMFFFKREKEIFGCPEESRLVFAKLKNPDEDVTPAWDTEASFIAFNLSRGVQEDNIPKRIFYKADIQNIKIMDRDQVLKELKIS